VLGKTNLPELAIITTTEPEAYGPCRNPWDLKRTVGGSSGGSGAAVAAGMVPVAHGTDAGGSIRIPASFCGVVGLKPSRGRTSQGPDHGDMWGNGSWHVHALTRSVRDTALVLDLIAGPAPGDPFTAPPPVHPYRQDVAIDPGRLRIGFMDRAPEGFPAIDPECRAAVTETVELLEELGHRVEPSFPDALDHMGEGSMEAFFGMAGSGVAWNLDRWSRLTGQPIGPEDVEPYTWAFAELGRRCTGAVVLEGLAQIQSIARHLAGWWHGGFDLLVTPTTSTPPFELGHLASPTDDPLAPLYRAAAIMPFTGAYNFTGQPAVSLPLYWTREDLPIGVQLGAAYGREDLLIRVAAQLEQARPWSGRRPPVHASR
jgi:amidase